MARNSIGIYASRDFGRLQPSVFITAGRYTHTGNSGGPVVHSGQSESALTFGVGLRYKVWGLLGLQVSYETTSAAKITEHDYKITGNAVYLPDDYKEPEVSIKSSGVYFGLSFNLGALLPSSERFQQAQAAQLAKYLDKSIDKNLPEQYQPFVQAVATDIANKMGYPDVGFYWRDADELLVLRMSIPSYPQGDIDAWLAAQSDKSAVYGKVADDYLQPILACFSKQAQLHSQRPSRFGVVILYEGVSRQYQPVPIVPGQPIPPATYTEQYMYYVYRGKYLLDTASPNDATLLRKKVSSSREKPDTTGDMWAW